LIAGGDSGIGRAVAIAYGREGADACRKFRPTLMKQSAGSTKRAAAGSLCRATFATSGSAVNSSIELSGIRPTRHPGEQLRVPIHARQHRGVHDRSSIALQDECLRDVLAVTRRPPAHEAGSAIVNTLSIQAFDPSPNLLAYASTKAAIANFTKALSKTSMQWSVRVNAVAPGPV
jgi:NAD(P)-dependent dehydrogenase (short-subunit alcohol dehydrogenase family)